MPKELQDLKLYELLDLPEGTIIKYQKDNNDSWTYAKTTREKGDMMDASMNCVHGIRVLKQVFPYTAIRSIDSITDKDFQDRACVVQISSQEEYEGFEFSKDI